MEKREEGRTSSASVVVMPLQLVASQIYGYIRGQKCLLLGLTSHLLNRMSKLYFDPCTLGYQLEWTITFGVGNFHIFKGVWYSMLIS